MHDAALDEAARLSEDMLASHAAAPIPAHLEKLEKLAS